LDVGRQAVVDLQVDEGLLDEPDRDAVRLVLPHHGIVFGRGLQPPVVLEAVGCQRHGSLLSEISGNAPRALADRPRRVPWALRAGTDTAAQRRTGEGRRTRSMYHEAARLHQTCLTVW